MVGLVVHESDFSKRLDSAARIAALNFREHVVDNIHWEKVDEMEEEHSATLKIFRLAHRCCKRRH